MTQNERLDFLINHLISEDNRYSNIVIPKDSEEKFNLFRSLVNVREPKQISNEFIKLQDDYLQERLTEINIKMRCNSKCRKQCNARLLCALPQVY